MQQKLDAIWNAMLQHSAASIIVKSQPTFWVEYDLMTVRTIFSNEFFIYQYNVRTIHCVLNRVSASKTLEVVIRLVFPEWTTVSDAQFFLFVDLKLFNKIMFIKTLFTKHFPICILHGYQRDRCRWTYCRNGWVRINAITNILKKGNRAFSLSHLDFAFSVVYQGFTNHIAVKLVEKQVTLFSLRCRQQFTMKVNGF